MFHGPSRSAHPFNILFTAFNLNSSALEFPAHPRNGRILMPRLKDGLRRIHSRRSLQSSGGHRRSPARQTGFVAPSDGRIFSRTTWCRQSSPKS
jgi:hypothetical protein